MKHPSPLMTEEDMAYIAYLFDEDDDEETHESTDD